MTLENILEMIKKPVKELTTVGVFAGALLAYSCGNGETNSRGDDDDDNNTTESCIIKEYGGEHCTCEDMSGTYSVHKDNNCDLPYTQIEIKQFPDQTSGTYKNCKDDPACLSFVIATNNGGESKCLNVPTVNSSHSGNYFMAKLFFDEISDRVELVQCNSEMVKMYTHERSCEFWLNKIGPAPNLEWDFNKTGNDALEQMYAVCPELKDY